MAGRRITVEYFSHYGRRESTPKPQATGTDVKERLRNTGRAIPNEKKMTWHFRDARRGCARGCESRRARRASAFAGRAGVRRVEASHPCLPPAAISPCSLPVARPSATPRARGVPTCLIPGSSGNWAADLRSFSLAHYSFRDKFPPELIERAARRTPPGFSP